MTDSRISAIIGVNSGNITISDEVFIIPEFMPIVAVMSIVCHSNICGSAEKMLTIFTSYSAEFIVHNRNGRIVQTNLCISEIVIIPDFIQIVVVTSVIRTFGVSQKY